MNRPSVQILLVEDDPNLRLTLADNLVEEGYAVHTAATAAEARASFGRGGFDVAVLDVMLPDGDGYTLCRELRQQGSAARVLMLTARTLEEDVVRGLDGGADDYVGKPYRLAELLARIRVLARRAPTEPSRALRLGRFTVDPTARSVRDAQGRELDLTRTEFDLLHLLLTHTGRALSRDEILDRVWGREVVVDHHTVDNFVSSLRRKLQWTRDSGFEIRALRGVGYRLDLAA